MPAARSPYYLLIVTLGVMLVMLGLTVGAAVQIHNLNRRIQNDNILATLDSTARLLDSWRHQYLRALPLLIDDPEVKRRAAALIAAHNRGATLDSSEAKTFQEFFAPHVSGMGYRDYSIIANDSWLLASSVGGNIRAPIRNPVLREQVQRTQRSGAPTLRPMIIETTQSSNTELYSGTLSLVLCTPLQPTPMLGAVLCLRIDANDMFIQALSASRVGQTGEAFIIDRDGRMLSPSRFLQAPTFPLQAAPRGGRYPSLWARTPPTGTEPSTSADVDARYPLSAVADKLLRVGDTGFMENYLDYRGVRVIGAGRWIDSMNTGLIVEQDVAEAYAPHRTARTIMIWLGVMEVFLVAALAAIFMRGRRELAVREARIRHLLSNIPALVFLRDTSGCLLLLNPAFEAEVNIKPGSSIGRTLDDALPPAWAALFVGDDDEAILRGKIFDETVELPPALQTARRRYFRILKFPVYSANRARAESIGTIAINITELWGYRMDLEELNRDLERIVEERTAQYLRAQHDAEAATRAKSEFLANMSHEIRTPLNAIIGLSYLSLSVTATPQDRGYLEKIHNAGQHLLDIINSILDFSKIEAGKMNVDSQPFLLQQLVDNVISFIWQKADNKGLEILVEIDPQLPPLLIGDSLRIGQILINFCNNAVKFTNRGEVTLRIELLQRDGDALRIRFAVSDTGIGIAATALQSLFQPFHQIDSSSTRRFEGTGLGLAISKNLAELLDGSISARSSEGVGSTFAAEIPLQAAVSELHPHAMLPEIQKPVLIVDDNGQARQLLAGMLRSLQFRVTEADSGASALTLVGRATAGDMFAFIFIDWKMPGLSGLETARQIKNLGAATADSHLVLITPHHSVHALDADAEKGNLFSAMLCKPITPSAVFDTIAGLLLPDFQAMPRHNTPHPLTAPGELDGARVLLVEDNDINQEVAMAILRSAGMTVSVASNGMEAIAMVRNRDFDVVLMDVQMPLLDGYATTRAIRADTALVQPPIIAMTANAMQGDREICIAAGMNDYVAKPIRPLELMQALSRWVRIAPVAASEDGAATQLPYAALSALGLDTHNALTLLLGSDALYAKVLRQFVDDQPAQAAQLHAAIQHLDVASATRIMHTLKATSATIGAQQLHSLSTAVEMELRADRIPKAAIAEVVAETARLLAGLSRLLPAPE